MKKPRTNKKSIGVRVLLSVIALAIVASGCAEPTPTTPSSSTGDSVAELQSKVAQVESTIDKDADKSKEAHDTKDEHNHDKGEPKEIDSKDQGMAMGEEAKDKGMGMKMKGMAMDGKGMKMKGMAMDGKGMKMKGMAMDGKGMKMKDMAMDGKGMKMKDMAMDGKGMKMKGKGMKMKGMAMDGKGMKMKGMGMMGMMHGDMGMMKMGDKSVSPSALPGFPGVSHIYHVGATGFFLDHTEHLQLSDDQKSKLETLQTESQKVQDEFEAQIEEAEKEIWTLTSSDEPNIEKILGKVRASETLRTEKRLEFIKAIGEAATVLSGEQQKLLISPSDDETAAPESHSH